MSFTIFAVYIFALPAYFGVLFPAAGLARSSIVDRINQVGFLIIHPAVIFFYAWQSGAIADLYRSVLPFVPASGQAGLLRASRIAHAASRIWMAAALVGGGVAYLGAAFILNLEDLRWYSVNWLMAGILQASRFLLFYMMIVVIGRHLTMAFNLNRVYRHVKLPVLIGDSKYSASFDAITRYGVSFAAFGGALGFFIAMRFFFSAPVFPEDAIFLGAYLVLVPLAFTLPFWQAHSNMRLAKLDAVRQISDALQDEYDRLMKDMAADNRMDQDSHIAALRSMLDLTEKAPTWPFENWDAYRVIAAAFFPFVMTGVGALLERWL